MNFLAIINAVKLVFQLLPLIHDAVNQIELLFPQGGMGQQKLEMVKGVIEKAMSAFGVGEQVFSNVWPMISGLIAQFVSIKNAEKPAPYLAPVEEKSDFSNLPKVGA